MHGCILIRWSTVLTLQNQKVRPRIAPGPDLTGARGTSARAAISLYVVTTTAAVRLLAVAPHHAPFRPSRGERQVFLR
jgi:hypothetical protein